MLCRRTTKDEVIQIHIFYGATRCAMGVLELFNINFGPKSCELLAEILNVVQVFTPAFAVYCLLLLLLLFSGQQAEMPKPG